MCGDARRIRQRIFYASCFEGAQTQDATVAYAAGFALISVTRPGELQRSAQVEAAADDLSLTQCDERSRNLDASLFCTNADHLVEGLVVLRTAIGVAGAVLRDCADVYLPCSQHFSPT